MKIELNYLGKVSLAFALTTIILTIAVIVASAETYTNEALVNAIYQAEGADKATYPYGIRSVSCEGLTECRQVCLNTVRNNRKRYADYGHKKYDTYLEFLASRYAPTQGKYLTNAEKRLNIYWLKNVLFFLCKGD